MMTRSYPTEIVYLGQTLKIAQQCDCECDRCGDFIQEVEITYSNDGLLLCLLCSVEVRSNQGELL